MKDEPLKPGDFASRNREAEARRLIHVHHPALCVVVGVREYGCTFDVHLSAEASADLELAADVKALLGWAAAVDGREWSLLQAGADVVIDAKHGPIVSGWSGSALEAIHAAAEAVRKGEV
jgi:hypothetical protein